MKNLFLLVALTSGLLMVSCTGELEISEVPVHTEQSETIIIEKVPAKKQLRLF